MHKISDGFIHLIVRWIFLSKMLDVRKDAGCTFMDPEMDPKMDHARLISEDPRTKRARQGPYMVRIELGLRALILTLLEILRALPTNVEF